MQEEQLDIEFTFKMHRTLTVPVSIGQLEEEELKEWIEEVYLAEEIFREFNFSLHFEPHCIPDVEFY